MFLDISDVLDDLYGLESALKNPTPHDDYVDDTVDENLHILSLNDEQHVRDKFPRAAASLISRLGKANAKRREKLRFWRFKEEARLVSLSIKGQSEPEEERELGHPQDVHKPDANSAFVNTTIVSSKSSRDLSLIPSTIPSTLLSSIFDESPKVIANPPQREAESETSEDSYQISETSYAVTVNAKEDDTRIRMPKPPSEFYKDENFDCPYCFLHLTNVKTEKEWK